MHMHKLLFPSFHGPPTLPRVIHMHQRRYYRKHFGLFFLDTVSWNFWFFCDFVYRHQNSVRNILFQE